MTIVLCKMMAIVTWNTIYMYMYDNDCSCKASMKNEANTNVWLTVIMMLKWTKIYTIFKDGSESMLKFK